MDLSAFQQSQHIWLRLGNLVDYIRSNHIPVQHAGCTLRTVDLKAHTAELIRNGDQLLLVRIPHGEQHAALAFQIIACCELVIPCDIHLYR